MHLDNLKFLALFYPHSDVLMSDDFDFEETYTGTYCTFIIPRNV